MFTNTFFNISPHKSSGVDARCLYRKKIIKIQYVDCRGENKLPEWLCPFVTIAIIKIGTLLLRVLAVEVCVEWHAAISTILQDYRCVNASKRNAWLVSALKPVFMSMIILSSEK